MLTINNSVEADEADYACQATNVAGSASSSNSRLIVNGGKFIWESLLRGDSHFSSRYNNNNDILYILFIIDCCHGLFTNLFECGCTVKDLVVVWLWTFAAVY